MKGALLRRRERPVHGAGGRTGRGGHREVRALRLVDRWEVRRGRGGRREERLCGGLAVRHGVLGEGPEHRLILAVQVQGRHGRGGGGKNRQERKRLVSSAEPRGAAHSSSNKGHGAGPTQPAVLRPEAPHPDTHPAQQDTPRTASPTLSTGGHVLCCGTTQSTPLVPSGTQRVSSAPLVRRLVVVFTRSEPSG